MRKPGAGGDEPTETKVPAGNLGSKLSINLNSPFPFFEIFIFNGGGRMGEEEERRKEGEGSASRTKREHHSREMVLLYRLISSHTWSEVGW